MVPSSEEPQQDALMATSEQAMSGKVPEEPQDDPTMDESESCASEGSYCPVTSSSEQTESQTQEPTETTGNRRKVGFSTLHIREYPMIPGDNPSVTMGCPITIDWQHDYDITCHVAEYEEARPKPRSVLELRLPAQLREDLLKRAGFSRQDILKGTKEANITKGRRRRTQETMKLAPIQELMERAKRGTLNMTIKRGSKKKERELKALI